MPSSPAPSAPKETAAASEHTGTFDAKAFFHSAGVGKTIVEYQRGDVIFTQGDPCESVLYIQQGGVKISVLSKAGREVVVATLSAGDFVGEGGLAGQPVRMGTATAITRSAILFVAQDKMAHLLHEEPAMADWFIARMLVRNIRVEEDLVDQLFNASEKRLARRLFLLAQYRQPGTPAGVIPTISQEALAEMVGTTRSRVNFFLKKFERLGFIDCTEGLKVNQSLLTLFIYESGDR